MTRYSPEEMAVFHEAGVSIEQVEATEEASNVAYKAALTAVQAATNHIADKRLQLAAQMGALEKLQHKFLEAEFMLELATMLNGRRRLAFS